MKMDPARYRIRFLLDLFHIFVVPISTLSLASSYFTIHLGLLSIPTHLCFIILWAILKGAYTEAKQDREARSMGAQPIPRVVGKWPGNVDVLLKMMGAFKNSYILDVYLQLFEEYQCSTLNLRILWRDNIISMDQEHSKFVLATGFHKFWRGALQKERMETFLGGGIFNRDDEVWKMHRNIARPFFARDRFSDFDMFERHCAHTLSRLNTADGSECVFEAQDLYSRFSIDTASEFLFGKNLDTLSGSLPVPGESSTASAANSDHWGSFTQAFDAAKENITRRGRLGAIWPLFELFKDWNEQNCDVIRQWVDPLVQHALQSKSKMAQAGVSTPIDEKNFLQHLADSIDDPVLIRDQLISMLLASRDTTACVLTFITYFMAIHPEVAEKLRAEVLDHCGSTLPPTFEHFKQMKYMRAVINETLRLFPPLPLNLRECRDEPCVLPPPDRTYSTSDEDRQPLYMPANTTLLWVPLLIHRNPTLWGNDADEFKPERWIDSESLSKFIANPMMFTPFSAGPRICVGQNYAYNEMSYFLVRLLQQYDRFTLAPEFQSPDSLPPPEWKQRKGRQAVEKIWPSAALTLYVKGGMWVRFHKAQS